MNRLIPSTILNMTRCECISVWLLTSVTQHCHNCLYGWPRVVSPYRGFSPAVWGLCSAHRGSLYLQLPVLAQWLQLWILVFVITVFIFVAQWKGRLKVDPVEAQSKVVKETAWLFSYHSKTFLLYSFASSGTGHFKARQSRVFDKFTTTHCFLICLFNINWIPDHCITPLNCMHNASSVQCCNS